MNEKLDALKVYVLWSWLERHPDCYKSDYPLFFELGFNKALHRCPWCDIWWNKECTDEDDGCPLYQVGECCTERDSLFNRWFEITGVNFFLSTDEEAEEKAESVRTAGDIARIAWAEYKRLGG